MRLNIKYLAYGRHPKTWCSLAPTKEVEVTQPCEDGWHLDRQGEVGRSARRQQQPCSPSSKNVWDSAGKCPHADSGITAY